MKKKFLLTLLGLVCALCCIFGLAACGGATKLSIEQFDDEGIIHVELYAASQDEYEKHKDDKDFNGFRNRGACFEKYEIPDGNFNGVEFKVANKYEPIKLGSGEWYGIVTVAIEGSYLFNDLKVEINGEEKSFLQLNGIFGGDYFAEVGWFSGKTQIKFKGNTKIKTFKPTITLKDYEENKDCQDAKDLRFKASLGDAPYLNGGTTSYNTPIEYNSKTEFTATELKAALESKELTYYQSVKVTAYFENRTKFFVDYNDALAFFNDDNSSVNLNINNTNKEVTWEFNYNFGRSITLEYSKLTTTPSIKGKTFNFSTATGDGASEANAMYAGSTISLSSSNNTFEMWIPEMHITQSGTYTQNRDSVTLVITKRYYTVNGYNEIPIEEGTDTIQCTYDGRNLVAMYEGITLTYVDQAPAI